MCDEREALIGAGAGNGSLRRVSAPLALPLEHYLCSSGLDARGVLACTERYGRNVVEVKVPTFMALYQEQLLSPVSMFQVFLYPRNDGLRIEDSTSVSVVVRRKVGHDRWWCRI